jgi:hypothetical protein
MRILLFFIALTAATLLLALTSFAQTDPYYQLPKERTEKGVKTFPNIQPILTKFYFRGEGGTLFQNSSLTNDFKKKLLVENQVNINWGLSVGYNYRDLWMIDIGYTKTPYQLSSLFDLGSISIPISETFTLNSIPIRFQRNVWVVDRITRSTRLFIGGAILLNTNGKAAEVSNSTEAFLRSFSATTVPDTIRLAEVTSFAATPVIAEFSVELRGKLAEGLEIGTYAKLISSFKRPYQTEVSYRVNNNPTNLAVQKIKPLMFRLGIVVHYNFGIITKYESNVK